MTLLICMAVRTACYYNTNILSYLIISLKEHVYKMPEIRPETQQDIDAIGEVTGQAFGQQVEVDLVNHLREHGRAVVSLVAEIDGRVVGHILFSPATVESDNPTFEVLCLAPVSVLPAYQRQGIGSQLIRAALEECRLLGHEVVVLVGHPEYYPRFGFVRANALGLECEFEAPDEAWMAIELRPGALAGRKGRVKFQPEFQDAVQKQPPRSR
ncbi:MAG: N-acetyltransferase [Dehalococcoidia bacterium]|nr:N-acetyltransferase [Dehalococcoidia bacterium]MDD5495316.1 N-acetyltransferase [Dehalococcoidia bacterium]